MKKTLFAKSILILLILLASGIAAGSIALYKIRAIQLRNTASAIAQQVVAFRSWIAKSGAVWVDKLHPEFPDYLAARKIDEQTSFYSKNPALATRELSQIKWFKFEN